MYNYLTNRRMNYYKNVAKLVSKRDFCKKNYDAVLSKLKQDVQMLEYVMQTLHPSRDRQYVIARDCSMQI